MALSDDQIKLFRHNGFLRLPGRLPDTTVAQLKETILKDVENVVEPVVRDKNGDVIRLSQVLDRDPDIQRDRDQFARARLIGVAAGAKHRAHHKSAQPCHAQPAVSRLHGPAPRRTPVVT